MRVRYWWTQNGNKVSLVYDGDKHALLIESWKGQKILGALDLSQMVNEAIQKATQIQKIDEKAGLIGR